MKELKKIIQEVLEKEMKTQNSFDWKKYYPDNFKNNLEIEGDNVVLYHYGTDGGTGFLSPKFFGKYSYTLSDVKQWNKPRVFFYVHRKDKELRVTGKEYVVKYPLNKLYPFNEDPYYFYEECKEEINGTTGTGLALPIQLSCIGNKAEKAGFDGMILGWNGTLRADIWKDISV